MIRAHFQDLDAVNVMLDLETLGTSAGCAILSIGAQTFRSPNRSRFYYEKIDPASSRLYLREDIETLRWWNRQDRRMKEEAFSGTTELPAVLDDFAAWLKDISSDPDKLFVWGNGADFDQPILAAAYERLDRPIPWKPWHALCYRTLKELLPQVKAPPRASVSHHALEDAIYQAEHATLLLQVL